MEARHRDAECLHGCEWISKVHREMFVWHSTKLHNHVIHCNLEFFFLIIFRAYSKTYNQPREQFGNSWRKPASRGHENWEHMIVCLKERTNALHVNYLYAEKPSFQTGLLLCNATMSPMFFRLYLSIKASLSTTGRNCFWINGSLSSSPFAVSRCPLSEHFGS